MKNATLILFAFALLVATGCATLVPTAIGNAATADRTTARLGSPGSQNGPEVELKMVPLSEFMQNGLEGSYLISIPVPKEYKPAQLKGAPFYYCYWMRSEDAEKANATGDLPSQNGFMYGKISLDVGYDEEHDVFIGAEDPAVLKRAKNLYSEFSMERTQVGAHKVLILTGRDNASRNYVYAVYIATNIETNVVYIAYRPPRNSKALGGFVWKKLRQALEEADRATALD